MLLLVALGLMVIYSTSFKATRLVGLSDVWHQMVFAAVGLVAFFVAARTDYRAWSKMTPMLYWLMLVSLAAVLLFSRSVLGAQRWIDVGFFQFQPSEFAKIIVIIVLAKFFA